MLLNFEFSNWKIYKGQNTFSMYANTRLRTNTEHVVKIKYNEKLLPFSAIYGANNSGKSAFINAIDFCQRLVISNDPVSVLSAFAPYQLTDEPETDSTFNIEFYINSNIYKLSITFDKEFIISECLSIMKKSGETVLYHRHKDKYSGMLVKNSREYKTRLDDCPDNKLFLNQIINNLKGSKQNEHIQNVCEWFQRKLTILYPKSEQGLLHLYLDNSILDQINQLISQLDLGISKLETEECTESKVRQDVGETSFEKITSELLSSSKQADGFMIRNSFTNILYYISKQKDSKEIKYEQLIAKHKCGNQDQLKPLDVRYESDGTIRIIQLLPLFIRAFEIPGSVIIIDEIDRRLHSDLSKELIKIHLRGILDKKSESQLIVTTHDLSLLDLSYLRKDEFWLCVKDGTPSKLVSFDEFLLKSDKKLSTYYKSGSLGGVPFL